MEYPLGGFLTVTMHIALSVVLFFVACAIIVVDPSVNVQ